MGWDGTERMRMFAGANRRLLQQAFLKGTLFLSVCMCIYVRCVFPSRCFHVRQINDE